MMLRRGWLWKELQDRRCSCFTLVWESEAYSVINMHEHDDGLAINRLDGDGRINAEVVITFNFNYGGSKLLLLFP
jgi:hypothetical protein